MKKKDKRIYGIILASVFLLLIGWLSYSYFSTGFVYDLFQENPQELIEKIESFGALSYIIFVLFIIMECVFAPFPPLVLYIAGGAVFGGFLAGVLALVGNLLGAAIAFKIANKFGRGFVKDQIPAKTFERIDKFSQKHGAVSIFLLRINPLTSSDLLSYAAGFTKMNFKKFLFWTTLALIPTIFLQTYLGDKLTSSPWITNIVLIGGLVYLVGFIAFYFLYRWKKRK